MALQLASFEAYEDYDMSRYLNGLAADTVPPLNELACVVEGEITLDAHPFAARAMDLGFQCPGSLQEYIALPMTGRQINDYDIRLVRQDPGLTEEVRNDPYLVEAAAYQRVQTDNLLRHNLAVRTCRAAIILLESGIAEKVALNSTDGGTIFPVRQAASRIIRYAVEDCRSADYASSRAIYQKEDTPVTRSFVRHRILVAAAALAVHDATGKMG